MVAGSSPAQSKSFLRLVASMTKTNTGSNQDPNHPFLLGDYTIQLPLFPDVEQVLKGLQLQADHQLGGQTLEHKVHRTLYDLIYQAPIPCFLLAAVVDFIEHVKKILLIEHYSFSHFELWLNQFANISAEDNYLIRAKIVGKLVPRDAYQTLFPIGMGKMYPGSHYVTAHNSPDLDTTVASFWGWVDAFGARVSHGLHVWNVPGGPPSAQVEIPFLFQEVFGSSLFDQLSKTRTALTLSGIDLMTQKGLIKKREEESTISLDHERNQGAIVVVDDTGRYIGDWRNIDVEGVQQVVMHLIGSLRWLESYLHIQMTALFAKLDLTSGDVASFSQDVFGMKLIDCDLLKELSLKQQKNLDAYLVKVLDLETGLQSTYNQLADAFDKLSVPGLKEFIDLFDTLSASSLFDKQGVIKEDRAAIFLHLEKIMRALQKALGSVKNYVCTLSGALDIKRHVLGHVPHVISYRAEVEEIRSKMAIYPYLTVTASDDTGSQWPLGVIHALDMQKPILGTVSLRDFCNREETKIPSYFEVISVIDHHKTSLSTLSTPNAIISDQQSSNALVAEKAFEINDAYGLGGQPRGVLSQVVASLDENLDPLASKRVLRRLLQKQIVSVSCPNYFIDPKREYLEYLHFLYAILDDTDLLSKVSYRDLDCIASLLNRMKSIVAGKETEIIAFDGIPQGPSFVAQAARRILQNRDMYSLYSKMYHLKEESVEQNLRLAFKGEVSSIFADTKEQNGCNRVGQTKMFVKNYPTFLRYSVEIRALWYADAKRFYNERKECDLHMHMISTVPGAEEVFQGLDGKYTHKDELWLWIPSTEQAIEHLKTFLHAFKQVSAFVGNELDVAFLGDNSKVLDQIFDESFISIPRRVESTQSKISIPVAVIRYNAGTLNSRKAMISPYLPKM